MKNSVDPTLPLESEIHSANKVDLMHYFFDPTLPLESEMNTAHVFFASCYFSSQGVIPSVAPPPSPKVISFYWNHLV